MTIDWLLFSRKTPFPNIIRSPFYYTYNFHLTSDEMIICYDDGSCRLSDGKDMVLERVELGLWLLTKREGSRCSGLKMRGMTISFSNYHREVLVRGGVLDLALIPHTPQLKNIMKRHVESVPSKRTVGSGNMSTFATGTATPTGTTARISATTGISSRASSIGIAAAISTGTSFVRIYTIIIHLLVCAWITP